jgi:hypothetical protein
MRNLVLCAAFSPLALSGCADSEPAPTQTLDVTGQTEPTITSKTLLPGDTVVDHDLSAEVPDRGESVKAIAELVAGGSQTLSVETGPDGSVTITRGDPAADPDTCHSPGACSDPQFNLLDPPLHIKWPGGVFKWFFQAGTTPKANDVNNVETRLRSAAHNMGTGHNNCGISPNLSSSAQYQGRTTAAPAVTWAPGQPHVKCGRPDGHNVVGFGALPDGTLAETCNWASGLDMVEADTRINSNVQWYATDTVPNGCSGSFGIEPVMTHEFGHAFGLGHVKECHHGWLTMSVFTAQCDNSQNTLGLGDIKGMQQLYGM